MTPNETQPSIFLVQQLREAGWADPPEAAVLRASQQRLQVLESELAEARTALAGRHRAHEVEAKALAAQGEEALRERDTARARVAELERQLERATTIATGAAEVVKLETQTIGTLADAVIALPPPEAMHGASDGQGGSDFPSFEEEQAATGVPTRTGWDSEGGEPR